jgi:K+:H+ antiporter
MQNVIPILIAAVAIATALNVALKRFGIPTVIGYIFTGVIIGSTFGISIHGNEQLEHVAEFGVVFLMFTIGLELSFSHLKSMTKEVFLYGALQVFFTGAVLALVAELVLGIGYKTAIIVGAGMALSSTAIVLKLLNESGKIKSDFGRNSLGILIFQDMAVIPILLMITIFTSQDKSVSELLTDTAINAVIALGILVVIGKFALGYVFRTVSNTNSKEIYMGSILLTVVSASYVAHHFGFSYSLGGFIAGMMIADTIYKYQVEADLIPFRDLLLGVFFVSVGLQIDPIIVVNNIGWVLLLVFVVMVLKTSVLFVILSIAGDKKTAFKTAITLAEIGEFSLVVFSLLLANNMLDSTLVQIFMVTIVMSMVATPFIINNTDKVVDWFIKKSITDTLISQSGTTGGRVILCGYGSFGETVSVRLADASIDHTIITDNTDGYVRAKEAGKNVVFGDASDRVLLESLHIREAMSTIIAIDDFEKVKRVRAAITLVDPELKVIARVATEEDKLELTEFNHELLLDGNSHTASLLVDQISRSRLLARETSRLKHLCNYSVEDPSKAIELVTLEQARLLNIISKSFNGLREEKDIMYIKALHDSFAVLSEIVGNAIADVMKNASLSSSEYETINTLLDNQQQLISMNDTLVDLAKNLKSLERVDRTQKFALTAVEGLDAVLLSLKDLANDYNNEDMEILRVLTADENGGISKIRQAYLGMRKTWTRKPRLCCYLQPVT